MTLQQFCVHTSLPLVWNMFFIIFAKRQCNLMISISDIAAFSIHFFAWNCNHEILQAFLSCFCPCITVYTLDGTQCLLLNDCMPCPEKKLQQPLKQLLSFRHPKLELLKLLKTVTEIDNFPIMPVSEWNVEKASYTFSLHAMHLLQQIRQQWPSFPDVPSAL